MRPIRRRAELVGTPYERWGGAPFFVELVDRFYDGVAADARLSPLYPEDLTDSRRHLALFLAQYWGGPPTYDAERGHPRLRMRHAPFAIGPVEAEAWVEHMTAAARSMALPPDDETMLVDYLVTAAKSLVNHPG